MKRPQLVSRGTLARMKDRVSAAWENREIQKCIELLERMNRLSPAEPAFMLELGRMHGLLYNYSAAEEYFERAYRLAAPNLKADTLARAGQLARDFYRAEISERYFQRAIEQPGATPEMFVKLAEIHERGRRMEMADSLVERALQIDRGSGAAIFARGHLEYRAGKLDEAERTLRSLLALKVRPEYLTRGWYELGAVLDRKGSYDAAMNAFLRAKEMLQIPGAPHRARRQTSLKQIAQMREQISAPVLERWFDFGRELQPSRRFALLGGHPRSGTTLLEQVLDSHKEIVAIEETDHFSDYVGCPLQRSSPLHTPIVRFLDSAPKELLLKCRGDYFRAAELQLGQPIGDQLLVDKNPSLTMRAPDLARVFPEIKFLIALRDPRDVVLSCFMQPFVPIQEVSASFLTLGTTVEEYVLLMGIWRTVAPMMRNPYLEVRYEDMVGDLESVARRVLDFLGVSWDDRVLEFHEHARQKLVRSPTYADVTQKVFTRAVGRWRHYQKYLEPHLAALEPLVKQLGYE